MVSERCLWETAVETNYWDCDSDVRNRAYWGWGEMGCR